MNAISRYFFTLNRPDVKETPLLRDIEERTRNGARLCKHCRRPYVKHDKFGPPTELGPWCQESWPSAPHQRHFSPMTCEACVVLGTFDLGGPCGKECIPGLPVCMEHMAEMIHEGDLHED